MKRLTTPTHSFILEVNPNQWDEFVITYVQAGKTILEKTDKDDFTITEENGKYKIAYQLTQEETSKFVPNSKCRVQIRCHYPNGSVMASEIATIDIEGVLGTKILGSDDA